MTRASKQYTAEDFTHRISVKEYIAGYRDEKRILGYCQACRQFAKSWACPPYSHDLLAELMQYKEILLLATKVTVLEPGLPISEAQTLLRPERIRAEKLLRDWEREKGGKAFAYAGECLYCPPGTCTRSAGEPCRHPELVRPSLEAYGFDIAKTTSELFGIELKWGREGLLPEYLVLVSGLFY
ncbi:MAG: DUF2284 domain-containing protein [Porphyromonas sp.]|nr:DUF2284 domain-containing protein [Porphyromonas sp.]